MTPIDPPAGPAIKDRSILFEGGRLGVLLIHGLGGTPTEMKFVGRRLVDTGATVLCCQLAGHCGTEADLVATTWTDWAASASAALDALRARCDTVLVGGLSMGAVIAAKLAADRPQDVAGLIMLAPTLWYDGWATPWYRKVLQGFIHTSLGKRWRFVEQEPYGVKDDRIRAVVKRAMFSGSSHEAGLPATPGHSVLELTRLIKAARVAFPQVKQRTFLAHARQDDCAGLSNAFYLQRHLGGLVEALILDDSYHLVTVDRQRDVVIERLATFVRSFEAAQPAQAPLRPAERARVA